MGKPYSEELDALSATCAWVSQQEVGKLSHFLNRWSGDCVAVVGSGGSFSAAVVGALFRELAHHSPTYALTPHEFASLTRRLAPRVLLLSAEGKNKDILASAKVSAEADLAAACITLQVSNPLLDFAAESRAIQPFSFQMSWIKDGYLATNSLLATVLLLYRTFFGQSDFERLQQSVLNEDQLSARRARLQGQLDAAAVRNSGLIVLYGAQAKAFAIDIESKLTESALAWVQLADLRQFAHGRHLQLASPSPVPPVLIAFGPRERALAEATAKCLPMPAVLLALKGEADQDLAISGILDAIYLTEAIAKGTMYDPGQPDVPTFGREIHSIDPAGLSPVPATAPSHLEVVARRKVASSQNQPPSAVVEAAKRYSDRLCTAKIKAIVADFDGTLCRAEDRFEQVLNGQIAEQLSVLLRQGLVLGIATGRGDSVFSILRASFDAELHSRIVVGYYSGSYIANLSDEFSPPEANPAFNDLWAWLSSSAFSTLCSQDLRTAAKAGQLSLRVGSYQQCGRLRAAVLHRLEQSKWSGWRVYCSGHSIDVLDPSASKKRVVSEVARIVGADPQTEILRLGDSGQEDGNDFELLNEGMSLSCERVSSCLASCWNFGRTGSNQADVTTAYLRGLLHTDGAFRVSPSALGLD